MQVEVVYATPEEQTLIAIDLASGASAAEAVQASGILERHPEIEWPGAPLGVFSQRVEGDTELQSGDRVEIYRPLLIDPKQARRERAEKNRRS